MADMNRYLNLAGLEIYDDKIKEVIKAGDDAAKAYADSLASNYDVAGAAATAEANAKAHAETKVNDLANGAVKANTEAIAKLNGDATTEGSVAKAVADAKALVDADVDAVEAIANKNKEDIAAINNEESGILAQAKGYTDTEVAKVQGEVDALEVVVQNIQENAYDDTEIRGMITDLEANKADKTQVATDIAAAVKVETDARVEAVAGVQAAADKAQEDVDALAQTHATDKAALEAEDARIASLVTAEEERAVKAESKLEARIETMEVFWDTAEDADGVVNKLKEIQDYIAGDESGAAEMAGNIQENTQAIAAMDAAYKAADQTLQGNIDTLSDVVNTKADASDVETLEGRVDDAEAAIEALGQADASQVEKIAALEAKFGEGEGSVEDLIADAVDAGVADAVAQAETKDAQVLADAKSYTNEEVAKDRTRLDALESASATHATKTEVEAVSGKVTTLEGKVSTLETEMDAVEKKASDNEAAIGAINTELAKKAAQTDLDNAVARIAQNETDIAALGTDKADVTALNALAQTHAEDKSALEAKDAELAAALAKFTPITKDEIAAMF